MARRMKGRARPHAAIGAAVVLGLLACGGDDALEAAGEELAAMEQEVTSARAVVLARTETAEKANAALEAARATLEQAEEKLAEAKQHVAEQASDAALFRAVQGRLLEDDELEGVAISASVRDRVVTLEGSVPDEELKLRAEAVAKDTAGVTTIINQITVRAGAD